jgi:carboxyl-terminal processing protease
MSARARTAALVLSLLVVFYVALGGLLGRTVSEGAYQQLAVLSEVLTRIQGDYVEDPNIDRVTVGAMRGLMEALDPYSSYLSPREFSEYQKKKAREHEGSVGLVLSKRYGLLNVINVLPGSPAAGVNLGTGDIIESIGGFSSREMSVDQGYLLLTGEVGTTVEMAVVRQARSEPQTVELVRSRLRAPRVVSGPLEDDFGYLKVASFSEGKTAEVAAALRRLEARGMRKLVLDLRDCASGEMREAVGVSRLLLDEGMITYLEGQQFPRRQFEAEPESALWRGPLTVLINIGTAGPAEVVAAAVLENKRGEVVGQRSYGMGSRQRLIPLEGGAALILSVAKYYSPTGKAIQDVAVTPSVEVTLQEREDQVRSHAMPPPGDPVLLKALEILRAQPASTPAEPAA